MAIFSPKIEIINHYDNLINRVDIDIDNCLEKYNEQFLNELLLNSENKRKNFPTKYNFKVGTFTSSKRHQYQTLNLWSESTKVIDYLSQVRMETIDELRKAQDETLQNYSLNSCRFKSELFNEKNIDELRSELFAEKFMFSVNLTNSEIKCWSFNVFTFLADFYMSPSDIDSLEKLINGEKEPFSRDYVFDHKTVLISLLYKYFIDNLLNFPNHVIRVCKQDVLNIESIVFDHEYSEVNLTSSSTIDLSKLVKLYIHNGNCKDLRESVKINIEGLSSLKSIHLGANSSEMNFSIRYLRSLTFLSLYMTCPIDENIITQVFDRLQHIKKLTLNGNISYINLDKLVNLKLLILNGTLNESSFNFELLKNLCNQIRKLRIGFQNIDENTLFKLFDGHHFSNLRSLAIKNCNLQILKKEYIPNRFPMLRHLFIHDCNLETIENDAFSNLTRLNCLDLSNNSLTFIEKRTFSKLKNLKTLDLSGNKLRRLNSNFIGVKNSLEIIQETKNFRDETYKRYWILP